MTRRYEEMVPHLVFPDDNVAGLVGVMWVRFFERVATSGLTVDRAIWICPQYPAWLGVKPSGAFDKVSDEPEFVIHRPIDGIDTEVESYFGCGLTQSELIRATKPLHRRCYRWLRRAIRESYRTRGVQDKMKTTICGRFGVYTTQVDDRHGSEVEAMDWLAGNRLRSD